MARFRWDFAGADRVNWRVEANPVSFGSSDKEVWEATLKNDTGSCSWRTVLVCSGQPALQDVMMQFVLDAAAVAAAAQTSCVLITTKVKGPNDGTEGQRPVPPEGG